jgi:membrane-associated phospholipid phosphatase
MTLSAEGILGYWDGTHTRTPPVKSGWDAFAALQVPARMAVLQHTLAPLFRVGPAGAGFGVSVPFGAGTNLLTLTPPGLPQLEAQLIHVRTAADLRADRLSEIVAQMGEMLSFYGAHFRLHPDARRWTLTLLSAAYEAVVIPEMQLKFHASLPRPFDFAPEVQPVIETPAHSTYPSGHATEAFAFATILVGLEHARNGAANPAADVLATLAAPNAATTSAMLPFRLAARIADNRTVAGVHFPVDSAHGALLGLACGLAVLAACHQDQTTLPVYAANGVDWVWDFTLDRWLTSLPVWQAAGGGNVTQPATAAPNLLHLLFNEAVQEWQ